MYLVVRGVLAPGLALISVLSASLAGIIVTAIVDGRDGLKLMASRLLIWRVGIGYWLFAILFLVPTILFGFLVNPLFGGDSISFSNMKPAFNILPMFIGFVIVAGLGQELGWTGFLMPRLQTRFTALRACVIRAVLGAIWHLPLFGYSKLYPSAFPDFPYADWIAQKGFLVAMMVATVFLLSWSILFGWMFNNTKASLLLVSVLHGSEIWLAYWMLRTGVSPDNLDNYWGYGTVMVLIVVSIVIKTGPQNLSRKYERVVCRSSCSRVIVQNIECVEQTNHA